MKTPRLITAAMLIAFGSVAAFGGRQDMQTITGSVRSAGSAMASILSRRSPEEARAIMLTLENVGQRGPGVSLGSNTGFDATAAMFMNAAAASDRDAAKSAWATMSDFDRQSLTILARAAYFSGDQGPVSHVLVPLDRSNRPTRSPDYAAVETIASRFAGNLGEVFRNALATIESSDTSARERNLGQIYAEKTLLAAVSASDRDAFATAWRSLDPSDREGGLILVRDAYFGGINDM